MWLSSRTWVNGSWSSGTSCGWETPFGWEPGRMVVVFELRQVNFLSVENPVRQKTWPSRRITGHLGHFFPSTTVILRRKRNVTEKSL